MRQTANKVSDGAGGVPEEDMRVRIGTKAPDFRAEAYHEGTLKDIQLSSHRGQWVVLLFYPADFTIV
jgi:NADH-dependent peroxiredoxin subunit C